MVEIENVDKKHRASSTLPSRGRQGRSRGALVRAGGLGVATLLIAGTDSREVIGSDDGAVAPPDTSRRHDVSFGYRFR